MPFIGDTRGAQYRIGGSGTWVNIDGVYALRWKLERETFILPPDPPLLFPRVARNKRITGEILHHDPFVSEVLIDATSFSDPGNIDIRVDYNYNSQIWRKTFLSVVTANSRDIQGFFLGEGDTHATVHRPDGGQSTLSLLSFIVSMAGNGQVSDFILNEQL